jgi:hypothetical protein
MPNHRWCRVFGDQASVDESLKTLAYSEGMLEACLHELDGLRDLVSSKTFTRNKLMERMGS